MMSSRVMKGIMSLLMSIVLVAGLVATSSAAEKVTVRIVAAWPAAAQFETQQFMEVINSMQKEADQKIPGQIVFDLKGQAKSSRHSSRSKASAVAWLTWS